MQNYSLNKMMYIKQGWAFLRPEGVGSSLCLTFTSLVKIDEGQN